ncbi:hypothetical protein Ocin01_15941 [Orchesella cincta]|uniref:Uncharacterized protein n=1 Tax=Orchesella cincta TaxID=48709 RepID=A0A1D2MCN7_ORCCI|nr:hypothetical protein Ocin01_15941 [Orchesella cincta]
MSSLGICLCPCMSLQKGVTVLAVIDAVLSSIFLALYILGLVALLAISKEDLEVTTEEKNIGIATCAIAIVIAILQILLALRLYYGGKNRDTRNCRVWLIATVVVVTIMVISFILNVSAGKFEGSSGAASLLDLTYKIYEMLVVSSFVKQLGQDVPYGIS